MRVVDAVLPVRLGRSFRWLLASSWVSNIGDGIAIAAGPLLVASLTHSKFLVALAALVQWLPPLVFGLVAGVLTDRMNRRRIVMVVGVVRCVLLAVIAIMIFADSISIAILLPALFLLGTVELFGDNATSTLLPMLVHRDDLVVGNARVQTGVITLNQLAGPPIGALLFAVGHEWPWVTQAVLVAAAVVFIARIRLPAQLLPTTRPGVRHAIAEGVAWTWRHAAVRTLVSNIFIFNITFGAAWSVLVLYAQQRLHLGALGFGLITTVQAAGGLGATLAYGRITRHVSLGNLMRVGLIIETLTHLGLALTTVPGVALTIFFVFGAHAFVWGTTSITVRQRAVPTQLQGRISAVNTLGVYGGLVLGSGVGGLLAERFGVTAPFWFAFLGSAVFVVAIWRQLAHIAHADAS